MTSDQAKECFDPLRDRLTALSALVTARDVLPPGVARVAICQAIKTLSVVDLPDKQAVLLDIAFLVRQTNLREGYEDQAGIRFIRDRYCITDETLDGLDRHPSTAQESDQ